MTTDRVMLLIDADNVSVDVMEQAVRLLLNQHGALHVRRAYCTAESAVANQNAFKRLGIKPMVNLAAGKNSTDIAMAVDAIDLVLAERPDVVVIASSDSDFAPLVQRLREKGCVVRGIGQLGKTGDETQEVYDDFTVLEHRKSAASAAAAAERPKRTPRKTAAAKTPATKTAAAKKAPAARKRAATPAPAEAPEPALAPAAAEAEVKPAARKTPARKKAAAAVPAPALDESADDDLPSAVVAMLEAGVPAATSAPIAPASAGRAADESRAPRAPSSLAAVLACLPELEAGQSLALNVAVQRLRAAQLLGKSSSSLKLFSQLGDRFELLPPDKPAQVRLRR
ncbi:NYN domain-containing protein [Rubrivivax rivuli]|uniref:NYN domain-containing protein n=1 Tax=Rubrivivax rivuli TaxID=1862385 RepID=A0A437RKU4_9BURK|nr:NYN domain-containing protein [Rubrivivax rivuli]RVU47282.1 NYN domain-containing protein [Rubrivivax rivuli]